jgi:hypothetical protein
MGRGQEVEVEARLVFHIDILSVRWPSGHCVERVGLFLFQISFDVVYKEEQSAR